MSKMRSVCFRIGFPGEIASILIGSYLAVLAVSREFSNPLNIEASMTRARSIFPRMAQ
jgi:hypothetical protein